MWNPHAGVCEDYCRVGCDAVSSGRYVLMFQTKICFYLQDNRFLQKSEYIRLHGVVFQVGLIVTFKGVTGDFRTHCL